jgi:hypothetical protein
MTQVLRSALVVLALVGGLAAWPGAQDAPPPAVDPLHRALDGILDIYVRDGLVYYQALKQERPRFDRYVSTIAETEVPDTWDQKRRLAFWINAYNALVLRTVIDHYPIRGRAAAYPPSSIRQVPGSFEKRQFRAARRMVTLDQIERDIIVPMDARAVLALGRGALGGGRLKSEAYTAERLDAQLDSMVREVVDRREMVFVDTQNAVLSVNPMFSWRERAFVDTFAGNAAPEFAVRSPLERAVLGLIAPIVVRSEAEFLKDNRFRMEFHDFDWRLNDLTRR